MWKAENDNKPNKYEFNLRVGFFTFHRKKKPEVIQCHLDLLFVYSIMNIVHCVHSNADYSHIILLTLFSYHIWDICGCCLVVVIVVIFRLYRTSINFAFIFFLYAVRIRCIEHRSILVFTRSKKSSIRSSNLQRLMRTFGLWRQQ